LFCLATKFCEEPLFLLFMIRTSRIPTALFLSAFSLALSGCGSFLPSSGPRASAVQDAADSKRLEGIRVVDLDSRTLGRLLQLQKQQLFSEQFGSAALMESTIGKGDVVEVAIWEVPPSLFGGVTDLRGATSATHGTILPEQMVSDNGTILIPFVGQVRAAGYTIAELQRVIAHRLEGKANQPQVLVRIVRNASSSVTVVGEVASSTRMPLTPRRERLLDAIAAAGGTRHPVEKMTVQLSRGHVVRAMSCARVISDPEQNIVLTAGDVVTLFYKPLSFTALGATGRNEEVDFEATGISLAQALGRVGGLREDNANAKGVFLFRFETPLVLDAAQTREPNTAQRQIPVVYRLDMKDPASLFLAQKFMMQDKDVLFVAHASSADLRKFLSILVSVVYPIENIMNLNN
jgi:polysaccharide export outer membrane protein